MLRFTPDLAALCAARTPVVVGVGTTSGDGVPARSARLLADRLGVEPLAFPGDHQGLAADAAACADIIHTALARPSSETELQNMTAPAKGNPASYFPAIETKYGRPVQDWIDLIDSSPLTRHMELVAWLKTEHGLGHGHANALVAHTLAGRR